MKTIEKIAGKNHITKRLYGDYVFRTVFITYISFSINIIYAMAYGANGILKSSLWLGTFSAYYIFLSLMRFIVLRAEVRVRKKTHRSSKERFLWRRYLITGLMLFSSAAVFSGFTIILISGDGGKHYAGYFIYVMCIYTFYKGIAAVRNLFKARKANDPLIGMLRHISQADALLSVLSLQTAMFASFAGPEEGSAAFITTMNGVTGGLVCIIILYLGTSMTIKAIRTLAALKEDPAERSGEKPPVKACGK